jgi:hypothetical protein
VVEINSRTDVNALNESQSRLWYTADNLEQSIEKRHLVYDDPELTAYLQKILVTVHGLDTHLQACSQGSH